ncbi:hypothetical protein T440DRAFT_499712 [Plenodomus tracheiphilus IPT5]|uniref:Uncharacterized protein n=1 Tax=Plenodomus tracheiphilus IPT5 TaxID=1408161 RepID=A0A6A7B5B2_9PLEO|nr:hypothetical protein T440DRAFT_499712 [Plenodomus tracheiphilus IPT5]
MSDKAYSNLIEGHARLQRRAQLQVDNHTIILRAFRDADEEIEQAWSKCNNATKGESSKLHRQVAKWIAENESRNAELRKMIAPQAQKSCHSLCDRVYFDLPREIRDNIYSFLHSHDTIYVGPEYFGQTKQPCESDRGAHYWDVEFVGEEIQRELIESWYRTTLFYFYDRRHNTEVVAQFLDTDRWNLGIKPRYFICKTRFELDASDPDGTLRAHEQRTQPMRGIQPLQNLHLLPNHVSFFLRIHTYRGGFKEPVAVNILQSTVKDLHRRLIAFRTAGHKFVVQWPDYNNLEFTTDDYALEIDVWMERLQAACPKFEPAES